MDKFKVGDKARVKYSNGFPELRGEVVTITAPRAMRYCVTLRREIMAYKTDIEIGGRGFSPQEDQLEPLRDDEQAFREFMAKLTAPGTVPA